MKGGDATGVQSIPLRPTRAKSAPSIWVERRRAKAFVHIVASEVLEHVTKEQGRELIRELFRCARMKVILITPNGFMPQEVRGVPTETHRSGWSARELRSAGFVVRGIGSQLVPLGDQDVVLSSLFHFLGTPLAQVVPSLGEYLIAVKTFEGIEGPDNPRQETVI